MGVKGKGGLGAAAADVGEVWSVSVSPVKFFLLEIYGGMVRVR